MRSISSWMAAVVMRQWSLTIMASLYRGAAAAAIPPATHY
jgi:hypothetical protein